MKKVIGKVVYDTETATQIAKHTQGAHGDPSGFEETLYQTPDGKLFLYVNGGEHSPYPQENIKRMSRAKADEWQNERS